MHWNLKRLALSAFLATYLFGLITWNLPPCAFRKAVFPYYEPAMMRLGLWQFWGMFAPNPPKETPTIEATVRDARGIYRNFTFPRNADKSPWASALLFRHSKYLSNYLYDELKAIRDSGARHVVRQLKVPADAFPVEVQLTIRYRPTPPFGGPPEDPMTPTRTFILGRYQYASQQEVNP